MSDFSQPPIPPAGLSTASAQRSLGGGAVPEVFANQMRMGVTVTDFTIVFGIAVDGGSDTAMLADKVSIHVAPGMLKQILLNIESALSAYEEVMGEIRVPNSLVANVAGIKTHLAMMLRQQMDGPESPRNASPIS